MGIKKKKFKRLLKKAKKKKADMAFEKVMREIGVEIGSQININDVGESGFSPNESDKEKIKALCDGPGVEKLTADSEVRFCCDRAGRCCFGRNIPVSPEDIWNIMKNDRIKKYGYWSTTSLLIKYNQYGFIHWGIKDGNPFGTMVFHRLLPYDPNSVPKCPMASPVALTRGNEDYIKLFSGIRKNGVPAKEMFWRNDDEMPVFQCLLGDDRPTVCKSYPIGRAGMLEDGDDYRKWRFLIDRRLCLKCFPESFLGKKTTVRDYIHDTGLVHRYKDVISWNMFCMWMKNQKLDDRQIYMASSLAFDFDRPLLKGGLRPTELDKYRPKSFSDMLERIKGIIIRENKIKNERRIIAPDEF